MCPGLDPDVHEYLFSVPKEGQDSGFSDNAAFFFFSELLSLGQKGQRGEAGSLVIPVLENRLQKTHGWKGCRPQPDLF